MERIMKGIAGILLMLLVFIAALAALLGRPWEKRADRPEELLVQYAVSYTHLTLPTNREV